MDNKLFVAMIFVALVLFLALVLTASARADAPMFASPIPPWCENTGGIQPCLPYRDPPPAHNHKSAQHDVSAEMRWRGMCIATARHWFLDESMCY